MYELRCYVLHSVRLYNIKRLVDVEARVKVTDSHNTRIRFRCGTVSTTVQATMEH